MAHDLSTCVAHVQRDVAGRTGAEIVVEDRAFGRIFGVGHFRREGSVSIHVTMYSDRVAGLEQMRRFGLAELCDLTQRRDVIENPESAAIGAYHKVVILDN